jgi:DMSO reductase anchor subunit
LLVFTFLAPILVAWFAAVQSGKLPMYPWAFSGIGLSAIAISTLHLGRRSRAFLAIANWRRSWLSREITCFSLFLGLSSLYALSVSFGGFGGISTVGWIVVAFGVSALFCIDMVYIAAATVHRSTEHSASALLTGAFYFGAFPHPGPVVLVVGVVKAALYVARKRRRWMDGVSVRPLASASRLGIGFVVPAVLWLTDSSAATLIPIACCLVGEFIDRCEFYDELDIVAPSGQIQRDQHAELQRTGAAMP